MKVMRWGVSLLMAGLCAAGCATVITLDKPVGEIGKTEIIEKYFNERELDLVEGVWIWDNGRYEVAIVRNTFDIYPEYDYIGVIVDTRSFGWQQGETKLMLRKTASSKVYSVSYFMGNKSEVGTTALLSDTNVIRMELPSGPYGLSGTCLLLRTYPQDESYSSSEVAEAVEKTGTGFAVSPEGHLITAYHIVRDATQIRVKFEGEDWLSGTLEKHSFSNDVAILKVDNATPNYLVLRDFSVVRQGEKVFTLGYPVVGVLGDEPKYTEGTISSLSGIMGEDSLIQISVPVQPGNSGGPLVTASGDVVGMITSTAAIRAFFEQTGTLPQNVNWAVKSNYVIPLLGKAYTSETDEASESIEDNAITIVRQAVCFVEAK